MLSLHTITVNMKLMLSLLSALYLADYVLGKCILLRSALVFQIVNKTLELDY